MSTQKNNNESISARGLLIFIIGFVLFIAIGTWFVTYYQETTQQPYLDAGCEPKTWGFMGSVSMWSCPPDFEPDN